MSIRSKSSGRSSNYGSAKPMKRKAKVGGSIKSRSSKDLDKKMLIEE